MVQPMDQLYDYSATLVAVSSVFLGLCILLVGLRIYLRFRTGTRGVDDYLLILGTILWIVSTAFVIAAACYGLGAHYRHYNLAQAVKINTYFFVFQQSYIWSNNAIKASLCITLGRIARDGGSTWIKWLLYIIIFITTAVSIGVQVFAFTDCKPFAATWDKTIPGAVCRATKYSVAVGYAYSIVNIVIDWTIALLPVILLWKVQMRWAQKLPIMGILALGIFASAATIIRMHTFTNLTNIFDYYYGIGPFVMWTVTEMGLVITCASLMAFRPLFRRFLGSTKGQSYGNAPSQDVHLRSRHSHFKHTRISSNITIPARTHPGTDRSSHHGPDFERIVGVPQEPRGSSDSVTIDMADAKYKQ